MVRACLWFGLFNFISLYVGIIAILLANGNWLEVAGVMIMGIVLSLYGWWISNV